MKLSWRILIPICVVLLLAPVPGRPQDGAGQIPPVPKGYKFVADYAKLLSREHVGQLGRLQRGAFEQHDVPIIVVTIPSMSTYGGGPIERLAAHWFDAWKIGTMERDGGANKGMLLLISTGDRRARIELGRDWGHDWDDYSKRIMDTQIIPHFKSDDYPAGIIAGVQALAEMAPNDPFAEPPDAPLGEQVSNLTKAKPLTGLSPIPGGIGTLMVIGGIILVVAGILVPGHRKLLIGLGIGLIVAALFLWLVIGIIGLFMRGRGFGSSGGFSGGFSGGGGASGSW